MMMSKPLILNDRLVVDVEIDGIDTRDYPDFCDAFFSYAIYADNGEELTEEELDTLRENFPDLLHERCFDALH
jgi:hypothetical protein